MIIDKQSVRRHSNMWFVGLICDQTLNLSAFRRFLGSAIHDEVPRKSFPWPKPGVRVG